MFNPNRTRWNGTCFDASIDSIAARRRDLAVAFELPSAALSSAE